MRRDQFNHRIHHAMRRTALTKLDRADSQRIAHGQRRIFREVFLKQAIRPFHPTQGISGQTLCPRTIIGGQLVQHTRRKKL